MAHHHVAEAAVIGVPMQSGGTAPCLCRPRCRGVARGGREDRAARVPRAATTPVVAARRDRLHRPDPHDLGRQVLEARPAPTARLVPRGPTVTTVADPPESTQTPAGGLDRDDPPVLGANPFVGLTRRQVGAALGRLLGRVSVEPGVVVTGAVETARQLVDVALGRSEVAPDPADKRFVDRAWTSSPVHRRLLQAYLVERDALFRLVDDVELDHKSRERARFALSLV